MIYKYTNKRAKLLKSLMFAIPGRRKQTDIIFAYGDTAFKFIWRGRTIEVSRYDEEIIIREVQVKKEFV